STIPDRPRRSTARARNSSRCSSDGRSCPATALSDRGGPGEFLPTVRKMVRENGPGAEPGTRAEELRGPGAMNDPVDPDRMPADDQPDADARLEPAMRAAFGPASTAAVWNRRGVLEALRRSTGVTSRVLLRDEPDAPSPVVGPGEEALAACGPVRYQVLG